MSQNYRRSRLPPLQDWLKHEYGSHFSPTEERIEQNEVKRTSKLLSN